MLGVKFASLLDLTFRAQTCKELPARTQHVGKLPAVLLQAEKDNEGLN